MAHGPVLRRRVFAGASAVLAAVALATPAAAKKPSDRRHAPAAQLSTCFWEGPISTEVPTTRGVDGRNFFFPEESATYWLARFQLPAGARLLLHGRYAHARHQSLSAYAGGVPTNALADFEIVPDPGSTNPFAPGTPRNRKRRSFTVTVLEQDPPPPGTPRPANTLYSGAPGGTPSELLLRVYLPDRKRDLTGDSGLPRPEVVLADGTVLRDEAACAAINDPNRALPVGTVPASVFQSLVNTPGADPATSPAFNPPKWERFFNLPYASTVFQEAAGRPRPADPGPDQGGLYSTPHNRYLFTFLSRRFGPVVVIRAKMPTFPQTQKRRRPLGDEQVRFWSLCSVESRVSDRTVDCLADYQVPLDKDRMYTIVVSRAADRPANATRRCGVAWLDWGERGDAAGRPDFGSLIMRNLLASPTFAGAIQHIRRPGEEAAVMGPYFPRTEYTTKAAFEALGCPLA
jgi:hypothetical protein